MNSNRRTLVSLLAAAVALSGAAMSSVAVAQTKAAKPLSIVVYGGSGNIGSRIVNEAAARGHTVTVVDRTPKPELAPKGVKLVTGDALEPGRYHEEHRRCGCAGVFGGRAPGAHCRISRSAW